MKKGCYIPLSIFFFLLGSSCQPANWKQACENPEYLHRSVKEITELMLHDIYSPPVASRIYSYSCIAGYEAALNSDTQFHSLAGQLHGLESSPRPEAGKPICYTLASVVAVLKVGGTLITSEGELQTFRNQLTGEFRNAGIPDQVYRNSIDYGDKVAVHILKWAAKDRFKQLRSLARYTVRDDEASWKPTPPVYMKAVEPHWNLLRPFMLDSAQAFKPLPATLFSALPSSSFYSMARDVHMAGQHLSEEQKAMADFWDCNPFRVITQGHLIRAVKKISPGGHWINIARLACRSTHASLARSAETYACLAIAISDSFISCWDEKFRSNVIRPETYINQYIDAAWLPYLQTPPFPEYTSGHSVISAASAIMLTRLYGENFPFTDSTEMEFGIPARKFPSFRAAAQEAALSRFYGGIHYMPSIQNGLDEGTKIGLFIVSRLHTRKKP